MASEGVRVYVLGLVVCAFGSFCPTGQRRARVGLLLEVAISVGVGSCVHLAKLPRVVEARVGWSQVVGCPRRVGFVPIVQIVSHLRTWSPRQLSWRCGLELLIRVASVGCSHSSVRVLDPCGLLAALAMDCRYFCEQGREASRRGRCLHGSSALRAAYGA